MSLEQLYDTDKYLQWADGGLSTADNWAEKAANLGSDAFDKIEEIGYQLANGPSIFSYISSKLFDPFIKIGIWIFILVIIVILVGGLIYSGRFPTCVKANCVVVVVNVCVVRVREYAYV